MNNKNLLLKKDSKWYYLNVKRGAVLRAFDCEIIDFDESSISDYHIINGDNGDLILILKNNPFLKLYTAYMRDERITVSFVVDDSEIPIGMITNLERKSEFEKVFPNLDEVLLYSEIAR